MNIFKGIAAVAAVALSAGCGAGVNPELKNGTQDAAECPLRKASDDAYGDFYANAFAAIDTNKDEINAAISEIKGRIVLAAGQDAADGIVTACENGVAVFLCRIAESQRTLEMVQMFRNAVLNCYTGKRLSDGSPDLSSEIGFDRDCFANSTREILSGKFTDTRFKCEKAIYECYEKEYSKLSRNR
jgi:hypothetical protein